MRPGSFTARPRCDRMTALPAALVLLGSLAWAADLPMRALHLANAPEGEPPSEMFVIDGLIAVRTHEGRKVIEISGSKPQVDAGAVIGDSSNGPAAIEAAVRAAKAGRTFPRFGLGVHGQTGFRLWVSPARRELQLLKGADPVKSVPFEWQSESWVRLRLEVTALPGGRWRVAAKAWPASTAEPAEPQILHETAMPTPRGQCSIWGTPYSGQPIVFDAVKVGVDG